MWVRLAARSAGLRAEAHLVAEDVAPHHPRRDVVGAELERRQEPHAERTEEHEVVDAAERRGGREQLGVARRVAQGSVAAHRQARDGAGQA